MMDLSLQADKSMDYPVQLASQLPQLLKSLRKSRQMTQAELALRLGVVQSRVADIERNPGAVSVEQMMQVLAMLDSQWVIRDIGPHAAAGQMGAIPEPGKLGSDAPRGQW